MGKNSLSAILELGWIPNYSASFPKLSGLPQRSHTQPLRRMVPARAPSPASSTALSWSSRLTWHAPYLNRLRTTIDGTVEKGYEKLLPLDKTVAVHLCPPTAIGWKAKMAHPSKPCMTTLAGRTYTSTGQAGSAFHTMFQAKLFRSMDESGPDPDAFRDLLSATDLALWATKTTRPSAEPWPA